MNINHEYSPQESFLRVATACPEVRVADVGANVANTKSLFQEAVSQKISLLTFPELSLTGYTLGDLVEQTKLLKEAEMGLATLAELTRNTSTAMVVGLPMQVGNSLYNCAAILADGDIKGIVPKSNLPTYNEFYEDRWYESWGQENIVIDVAGQKVDFGTNSLFEIGGVKIGLEVCEDLWVAQPPSGKLAAQGALIIANPSASPEQIGKSAYRRRLVEMQSGRLVAGYLYAGSHPSESTAEIVMGGHQIIAVNGQTVAECRPFTDVPLTIVDIDIEHLIADRRKQHIANHVGGLLVRSEIARQQEDLRIKIDRNPFLPDESAEKRTERLESTLQIQAHGLAMRMKATRQNRLVLGLSGGLDSTLALLVAHRASAILGKDPAEMIHTLTMPGPASTEQTQTTAQLLAKQLGVQNKVIPIGEIVTTELEAFGHDGITQDVTYENVQARARTSLLFNYANHTHAMVLGTGDLSEIALGWNTYNGDQQSHYNVNASIPKTLVRHLVNYVAEQPEYVDARETLMKVLNTVISPELTKAEGDAISQSTEDIIGPYELHDFFLYHLVRWGDSPAKIGYLAKQAFGGDYSNLQIEKALEIFLERFSRNQFKRDNMPNGPKVGSVSLSPRGDWRMPSDLYNAALWH